MSTPREDEEPEEIKEDTVELSIAEGDDDDVSAAPGAGRDVVSIPDPKKPS